MKWLRSLAVSVFLFTSLSSYSQSSYLFIKKGFKKKRIYIEGEMIHIKLQDGNQKTGTITFLKDSLVFINNNPVQLSSIKYVILIKKSLFHLPNTKTMILIGVGSVLTSIGLSLNNSGNRAGAIIAGPVIGFGPLMLRYSGSRFLRMLSRKKFRIGKKFSLQILDLRISIPQRKSF